MADSAGDRPDLDRQRLLNTSRVRSPFDAVVEAVSAYTEHPGHVYVEHFDDGWRWSPAHRGGSYPLLRVTNGQGGRWWLALGNENGVVCLGPGQPDLERTIRET